MNTNTTISRVAAKLHEKTKDQGLISFGDGVKNVIGARHTNKNIRLRIINNTQTDHLIYLTPNVLLGKAIAAELEEVEGGAWRKMVEEFTNVLTSSFENYESSSTLPNPEDIKTELLESIGSAYISNVKEDGKIKIHPDLPAGIPFFMPSVGRRREMPGGGVIGGVTISSLNPGQTLDYLGSALVGEPTQITAISMKSFTTSNVPENTNYGNSITHWKLSHLEEARRSTPLNFDAFQSSKDVSTEILKIDFIKNNFNAIISQKDVLGFQVNQGTKLDITLHIGGRLSMEEYFYRQTKAGNEVLLEEFPGESSVNC